MPYQLFEPEVTQTAVVFASPHSGRNYPSDMLQRTVLSDHAVRSSEDAYVDLLIADAPTLGAPLLVARTPRAYVDLNRGSEELDPALFKGVRRTVHNPRVTSGLGVIPRVVANGQAIYSGKLPLAEAELRIAQNWQPYHDTLARLLHDQVSDFGLAVLVDCHSMPHEAIEEHSRSSGKSPDVVLGDRFGAAADPEIVALIETAFRDEGLSVARNAPFAGAFITQHYGRPAMNQHVIQIELDRALYLDEKRIEPLPHFDEVKAMMTRVMTRIVDVGRREIPMAAE